MLPTWWYRPGAEALVALRGGAQAGVSQAALRVYIALAATPHPNREAGSYLVHTTVSALEDLTGLSRSMVLKGICRAVEAQLIAYEPGDRRHPSTFTLLRQGEQSAGGWAKLPMKQVHEKVPRLPHRGTAALAALKIYLTLIAARPNDNTVVGIRHSTLRLKTGCQTNQVRAAISMLANEGLVHVITEAPSDEHGNDRAQRYQLIGRLDAPRRWDAASTPEGSKIA